jgi:hypothetical protein
VVGGPRYNRNAETLRARTTAAGVRPWPASWLLWRWHSPAGFFSQASSRWLVCHRPQRARHTLLTTHYSLLLSCWILKGSPTTMWVGRAPRHPILRHIAETETNGGVTRPRRAAALWGNFLLGRRISGCSQPRAAWVALPRHLPWAIVGRPLRGSVVRSSIYCALPSQNTFSVVIAACVCLALFGLGGLLQQRFGFASQKLVLNRTVGVLPGILLARLDCQLQVLLRLLGIP